MKLKKVLSIIITFVLILSFFPLSVNAASAYFSGPSSVDPGDTITLTLKISSDNLSGASGTMSWDSSKLSYQSYSSPSGWTASVNAGGGSLVFTSYTTSSDEVDGTNSVISVKFKVASGLSDGTKVSVSASSLRATINYSESSVGSTTYSKTIDIADPSTPSTPSTSTKSSDNKLKALSVKEATISPAFSASTTTYSLSIPFTVEKLTITATANDSDATVKIQDYTLTPGETTPVKIVVTAENGSTKTYTINVAREQDPNYVPSENAYLSSIKASYDDITPQFDKDRLYYAINVPYSCESITFSATTEDKKATYTVLGNAALETTADNLFYIVVTAENGVTSKIYTITVRRDSIFSVYTSDSYIQEKINEISQQSDPVIMDMSTASVQMVSSAILTTLQQYPDMILVINALGGKIAIKGSDLTDTISEGFYDFTLNHSSPYSETMTSDGADGLNYVFSTHNKDEFPGYIEFSINTNFVTGTIVNVYRYDTETGNYLTIANNLPANGGNITFRTNHGGDFLITTVELVETVSSGDEDEQEPIPVVYDTNDYLLYGASGLLLLFLGLLIGIAITRSRYRRRSKSELSDDQIIEKELPPDPTEDETLFFEEEEKPKETIKPIETKSEPNGPAKQEPSSTDNSNDQTNVEGDKDVDDDSIESLIDRINDEGKNIE